MHRGSVEVILSVVIQFTHIFFMMEGLIIDIWPQLEKVRKGDMIRMEGQSNNVVEVLKEMEAKIKDRQEDPFQIMMIGISGTVMRGVEVGVPSGV